MSVVKATGSGTLSLDASQGTMFDITIEATTSITFDNLTEGNALFLLLRFAVGLEASVQLANGGTTLVTRSAPAPGGWEPPAAIQAFQLLAVDDGTGQPTLVLCD